MNSACLSACLLALALPAAAQLGDPTRPLQGMATPESAQGAATQPSGLQTIIRRKNAKPAALIDGTVVELGGKVGEATVVKITEDTVVLRGSGGEEEILRLTPDVEKILKVGAGKTAQKRAGQPAGGEQR